MSLPPGFLDELKTRISLSQVVGRKVTWDVRKSNQGKGDMWAPCPFHQEKSASFHVDDRKGFYHCFGCHESGDAIKFVRETENVSFMEAIEILAGEAGMPMPAKDPQAVEKADARSRLIEVMEQAVQYFRLQLKTMGAADARAYLVRRGLSEAAQERWEIGFAPSGWQGLSDAMCAKGVADDLLLEAGLVKTGRPGKPPYDVFRNRIMFPIRDVQGRAIGFGGRAMDPDDKAKYLNSPETPLFDKSRTLYNLNRAREASGKGATVIVAEGYMDVISLSEAGFAGAVAPLGTAVTEDQLRMMWRIADEPVIALDGDTAGLRAAHRVIDTALPLLEAGKGLRFCLLPQGMDPDDLLKAQGAGAMQKLVMDARPMVDLLWQRETEGGVFDSPERRAALDKALRAVIGRIADPHIRTHYGSAIKDKRWTLFNPRRTSWTPKQKVAVATPNTRASQLAQGNSRMDEMLREAVILAVLLRHPSVVAQFEDALERLEFLDSDHAAIAHALLLYHQDPDPAARMEAVLGAATLEKLFAPRHVSLCPAVRNPGDLDIASLCVAEELAKLHSRRGARHEIEEAVRDAESGLNEGQTWRLGQAVEARNRAERAENEDRTEFEIGANGARINRDERLRLDSLLEQINTGKSGTKARDSR
ncbi:DNA primase [Oceaniovalibus sp. ACAM 378]|uniref:DNA primase n=1 Tax=Oceaniovalibus sp. ACAM 378 TaxID=2599923 RepID=UPI0011DA8CF0|nr:DNA primase [Oceaniovalibus sp. ACAM 378]TYB88003.1 DNA primase [Oceaniovalibus sp. ACAM 378]